MTVSSKKTNLRLDDMEFHKKQKKKHLSVGKGVIGKLLS